jgi:uncharacterized membrane protein YdjX (TVP38/TMEM64 family)
MVDTLSFVLQVFGDNGLLGLAALTLAFAVGAMLFIPRAIMCAISGWFFGFSSIPCILVGTTAGAGVAFLVGRHLFGRRIRKIVNDRLFFETILQAIELEGWRIIFLMRIASPVPATLVNYILGMTRIHLRTFCAATFLGIVPQVILFVYLGVTGDALLSRVDEPFLQPMLLVASLFVMAVVVSLLVRRTRRLLPSRHISR